MRWFTIFLKKDPFLLLSSTLTALPVHSSKSLPRDFYHFFYINRPEPTHNIGNLPFLQFFAIKHINNIEHQFTKSKITRFNCTN